MRLFLSLIVLGYIAYVQANSCSKCNSEERIPVKTCPEPDSEVKVVYSGTACECQKALPYRVEVPAVEKQKLFKHKYNIFKTRDPAACSTGRFVYDAKVEKPVVPKEEFYAYPITVDKKKSDNNDHNCGTSSGVHYIYDAKVERPVHPKQTKLEGLTTKLDTIVLPAQDYSDCYQPGEGYKKKKTSSDYSNINSSSYEESELTPNKYNQPCEQTRSQENKKPEESCGCNKASVESLELKEETAPKKKKPIRIPNCEEKCGCDTVETRPCEEIQNKKRPKVNSCQKSEHVVQPYADNSGAEDIVLESSEESYEYKVKVPKRKKSKKCEQVPEESSEEVILTAKSSEERKKDCGCSGSSEEAIISSEESYECPKSKKKYRKVKPDSTEDYGYSSEEILISKSSKSAESPEYSEESCGCSKRRRYEEDSEYESEESEEYRKPRRKYSSEEYTSPEEESYEEPEAVYVKSRKSRPRCGRQ